jgi:hypothetical protein
MAFRIHESVVRGEIDNREKGVVRGRLWLHGRSEPVLLQLRGNAQPDLAGCLLTFTNPSDPSAGPSAERLAPVQLGTVGDMTASRKIRVFNIPFDEAYELMQRGEKPPEHLANCLYLEWFSEANGRVVIESADFRLSVSDPEWRLSPAEEQQRAQEAASGFDGFLGKLSEAVEAARHEGPEDLEEWDEFDFEKSMRESDAITDKYVELLEKYGDSPEAELRIAQEMGWDTLADALHEADDSAEPAEDCGETEPAALSGEELDDLEDPQPDPATEGVDWIRVDSDVIRHPLAHRAHLATLRLIGMVDATESAPDDDGALLDLLSGVTTVGAKLAGALNGLAYGRPLAGLAFTVAYLKRALDPLHRAQAALRTVAEQQRIEPQAVGWLRNELFEMREEILRLMEEFRRRRDTGT